jgi:hypothetical protein
MLLNTLTQSNMTTLSNVKAYLGIPNSDTNADALLNTLIGAASQFIVSECQRYFDAQQYQELRDSVGAQPRIVTLGYPLVSVASVTLDGVNIPPASSGAWPYNGYLFGQWDIEVFGYAWTCNGRKNVKLVYTAGFATLPNDLVEACTELAALKYIQKGRIGQGGSKSIAGQSISFKDVAAGAATAATLELYKRRTQIPQ